MTVALDLEGRVCSGLGEGSHFTQLDWALREFAAALGRGPHPGTFNLRMVDPRWPALRAELRGRPGRAITPPPGFCGAKCFRAVVDGIDAIVVLPDVADYPEDKLELIAAVPLRSALKVGDGDTVRLRVEV